MLKDVKLVKVELSLTGYKIKIDDITKENVFDKASFCFYEGYRSDFLRNKVRLSEGFGYEKELIPVCYCEHKERCDLTRITYAAVNADTNIKRPPVLLNTKLIYVDQYKEGGLLATTFLYGEMVSFYIKPSDELYEDDFDLAALEAYRHWWGGLGYIVAQTSYVEWPYGRRYIYFVHPPTEDAIPY